MTAPFDEDLPSPLRRLADLRYRATEAVVRDAAPTPVQRLMAPRGRLEAALWDALGSSPAPKLLVLTGSAGSGKSATINHLLDMREETGAERVGDHLADATHADRPDQQQAERLASFFSAFADDAPPPAGPCRVIALNTGMALRFFHDLPGLRDAPPLAGLEALLRQRLGLPAVPGGAGPAWLADAVLVVNLDLRPTAGEGGDLFDEILARLDPSNPAGVLEGAPRCTTCTVREWCWPMANATTIASTPGREALNSAAGRLALRRGRQIAPRALWDAAAELALSGLPCAESDPCREIAAAAQIGDEAALLRGLACSAALDSPHPGSLAAEIADEDPGFSAGERAHQIISDAGLDPARDAADLVRWLAPHPAVERAATHLRLGRLADAGNRYWGRMLARAAWLGSEIDDAPSAVDDLPKFEAAIAAQSRGAGPEDDNLYDALADIEEGLAKVFGVTSGPELYYPTTSAGSTHRADLLVEAKLLETHLDTSEDPARAANQRGAALVGYRQLSLSLRLAGHPVTVDFPLWRLLRRAAAGSPPTVKELERFLALRVAMRQVGVDAAANGRPLLVRQRGIGGRKFRLVSRGASGEVMRAQEVL